MTIDQLLALCETRAPVTSEIELYAASAGIGLDAALVLAALTVARRYASGQIDFATGDAVMNSLHGWSTLHGNGLLPHQAHQIFLAFDEGEYVHSGDSPNTDAEAKYTRPMINEVLRGTDAV